MLYHLVRRVFGTAAGLFASLFLAWTPIAVAVDRSNNTDTLLVLTLLLAAWALARTVETGRRSPLLLAAALVGIGFNVKMLVAFGVVPVFMLLYLRRRPTSASAADRSSRYRRGRASGSIIVLDGALRVDAGAEPEGFRMPA